MKDAESDFISHHWYIGQSASGNLIFRRVEIWLTNCELLEGLVNVGGYGAWERIEVCIDNLLFFMRGTAKGLVPIWKKRLSSREYASFVLSLTHFEEMHEEVLALNLNDGFSEERLP